MQVLGYNATTLASIGDAYLSLKVREYLVKKGYQTPKKLQEKSVCWVSAKAQAQILCMFLEKNLLTNEEKKVMTRGRNARLKHCAKNTDIFTYRQSTAFEAIFGYLYLSNRFERLNELWDHVLTIGETL